MRYGLILTITILAFVLGIGTYGFIKLKEKEAQQVCQESGKDSTKLGASVACSDPESGVLSKVPEEEKKEAP